VSVQPIDEEMVRKNIMPKETTVSGPYVAAAFLCEKVLLEQGMVPTFVRVVDRFTIPTFSQPLPPGVQMPQQNVQATLVVMVKAGDVGIGTHTLKIKFEKPDGSYGPEQSVPIFFQGGDENGAMFHLPIMLGAPQEGLYWFEVFFDEINLLSRIPMRILHQPAMLQQIQMPPKSGA
jgi:hypothetical protein